MKWACSLLGLAALGAGKDCFKSVVDVLKEELAKDNDLVRYKTSG